MCRGGRLIGDFVAGTDARPGLPEELHEHLTTTVDGLWVVWAHKLARQAGDLFVPLTGGSGYPADARAQCRYRGRPGCSRRPRSEMHVRLPRPLKSEVARPARRSRLHCVDRCTVRTGAGLRVGPRGSVVAGGAADRGSLRVVGPSERAEGIPGKRRHPGDPDGRPAVVPAVTPRDSGPVRLNLPVSSPVLPVCDDDAGWCVEFDMLLSTRRHLWSSPSASASRSYATIRGYPTTSTTSGRAP